MCTEGHVIMFLPPITPANDRGQRQLPARIQGESSFQLLGKEGQTDLSPGQSNKPVYMITACRVQNSEGHSMQ